MKTLDEMMDRLSPKDRKEVEEHSEQLIDEIMSLRDLRKVREQTQACMAKELGITQESVSRIEQRSDLLISTLKRHIEALGGQLSLVVKFPDRPPVELAGIADLDNSKLAGQS